MAGAGPCGCFSTRTRAALSFIGSTNGSGGRSSGSCGSRSGGRIDAKVVDIVGDIINTWLHGGGKDGGGGGATLCRRGKWLMNERVGKRK